VSLDQLTDVPAPEAGRSLGHPADAPGALPVTEGAASAAKCPVDHAALSAFFQKKTARSADSVELPDVEKGVDDVWHIRGFAEARAVLRSGDTQQAGFRADLINRLSGMGNVPILYQEGKVHQQQRKQTARFFTPKTVGSDYREMMETLADELIAELKRTKRADLSALTLTLAVRVAATVVGLTDSRAPGMAKRLDAFLSIDPMGGTGVGGFREKLSRVWNMIVSQARVAAFFYLDVKPAIEARKRQSREDVISHLLAQGYRDREILTECVTYAAAGMVTTREFISMATWHLLEQPDLRARYLAAGEQERQALLEEILRLEPVVGHLYRRATGDIPLQTEAGSVTIHAGELVDLHIHAANTDERVTGEYPFMARAERELHGERLGPALLSFGDGAHRCPGSYIALQESDIFLTRLLALDGLRMEHAPQLTWNELVAGYVLRDFPVTID